MGQSRKEIREDREGKGGRDDMRECDNRKRHGGWSGGGQILDRCQHTPSLNLPSRMSTFFNRLVASIKTSVSGLKLWTAPKYPTRFWRYLEEDMTSRTLKEAHDISWPNISRYISFRRAVALISA